MKVIEVVAEAKVAAMRRSVRQVNFGSWEEKMEGALEIKSLAGADLRIRRRLAELGVIPSLVDMIMESSEDDGRRTAVEALIELANGTFTNKMLMVEAGLLEKLPLLMRIQDASRKQDLALLLLSISSLVETQFPISSSKILPILIEVLTASENVDDVKMSCLATLYNLSTKLENTKSIVSSGVVHALLAFSQNKRSSQGALAILGNLVPTASGKKAIEDSALAPKVLIEVMSWEDKPKCQELAAYVLMVLAHGSSMQRRKMAGLGIVAVLLELALLGSPLAQKRALKLLQWFKSEGQAKMRVHSGPQAGRADPPNSLKGDEGYTKKCQRAIKRMVKQSLDRNMESIMMRASASRDFSSLKSLAISSSSSKSLPY